MAGHELACSETEAERVDQRQVERVIPRPSGRMGTRLTSIANRFQKMEKIGEGTYGVVYKARDMKKAGKLVALKKMWLDNREEGVQVTTLREVALLKDLNHENIIKMQEFICISPDIILVFDFVDQDLKQCLDKNFKSGLPSLLVKSCMLQILRGLAHCHLCRIMHRDLKPQNVLINEAGEVKIADFGLARACQLQTQQCYTTTVVTLWYRAPELLLGQQEYSAAVDIWSAGCIFAEVVTNKPLFPGDSQIGELIKIFQSMGTPHEGVWPGVERLPDYLTAFPAWPITRPSKKVPQMEPLAAELLDLLVVYDPMARMQADGALNHPYFDDIRKRWPLPTLDEPATQLADRKRPTIRGVESADEADVTLTRMASAGSSSCANAALSASAGNTGQVTDPADAATTTDSVLAASESERGGDTRAAADAETVPAGPVATEVAEPAADAAPLVPLADAVEAAKTEEHAATAQHHADAPLASGASRGATSRADSARNKRSKLKRALSDGAPMAAAASKAPKRKP